MKSVYPNVHVTMVTGGSGALSTQLAAQQASGHVQQVVLLADPTDMDAVENDGVLASWKPSLKGRRASRRHTGKDWIGAFTFEMVLLERPGLANPPQTWTDLDSPALQGQVAIGSASYSGTTFGWAAPIRRCTGGSTSSP